VNRCSCSLGWCMGRPELAMRPVSKLLWAMLLLLVVVVIHNDLMCGRAVWQVNGVKWHRCVYCEKEFKKPSDVVRHVRIHTHEKPYKCNHCYQSFAVKSTLTAHKKTHSGVKDFKCQVCEKLFTTQGSLKVHLRLHTGQCFIMTWVGHVTWNRHALYRHQFACVYV